MVGLKPWEFAELTMAEFGELVEGAREREERQRELAAWIVSHLMNSSGNMKQPVTMARLLGPEWTRRQIEADVKRKQDEEAK